MNTYDNLIIIDDVIHNAYPLAVCDNAPATPEKACTKYGWGCKKKKDESPMNYASATAVLAQDNTEANKVGFLITQLRNAYDTAKTALQRKFGLLDDIEPSTLADTVKRIQDGLFVIPEKYADKVTYGTLTYIRWRDPKIVEDKAGFEAAKADLKTAFTAAERDIRILPATDGLKALQDFEAAQAPKAK